MAGPNERKILRQVSSVIHLSRNEMRDPCRPAAGFSIFTMEMLALVHPQSGEPTGKVVSRQEVLAKKAWCRSTNVFVFNSAGEVLCHQRSLAKERLPGVWLTHLGGHVAVGETYESNAAKELEEEAGIAIPAFRILPWRTTRLDHARLWVREFVTLHDAAAETLVPQPGEVEKFQWLSPKTAIKKAAAAPGEWCVGTHDFAEEYRCMLSALAVARSLGALAVPASLAVWGGRPGSSMVRIDV